ncbi:lipid-binding protein [Mucilaginibacter sp. PAMB04274]|uniref:lipid-binding protein n=1 Tax=Mucilaginibacter sp. PAMB04274 TaxID=3138568 RepID=UPI0031F7116A
MKKIIYILVAFAFAFSSCRKDEIEAGGTNVQEMAGEFWVQADDGDDSFYKITTFNTASNSSTQMWLKEEDYGYQTLVNVNLTDGTFSQPNGTDITGSYIAKPIVITAGKIVKNGTKAPGSGVPTDLITFTATFSNASGNNQVTYTGYRRTKFLSDDH